jgi:purine-nucleoside/S-methyl-5'-thioadenosine phosphorylase / adenosine deaminase
MSNVLSEPTLWHSDLLAQVPGVRHAVTGRALGLGQADGNVGFSAPRNKLDAWAMREHWCDLASLDAARLVTLGQIHGAVVHQVRREDGGRGARPGSEQIGLGDALVTNQPGPVLMTLHADCQALLFVDPGSSSRGPAVGVAHAGWRGTVANVAGQTVAAMTQAFGTPPEDLLVSVGPAIGGCCYTVGPEVVAAWQTMASQDWQLAVRQDDATYFSLRDANVWLLRQAGVLPTHIEAVRTCTQCDDGGNRWFSHRGQGPATGRFGALITILED